MASFVEEIVEFIKVQYLVATLVGILIFVPLERLFPLWPKQRIIRTGWGIDLAHFLFDRFMIGFLLAMGISGCHFVIQEALLWLASIGMNHFGKALFHIQKTVQQLPAWGQLLVLVFVGDFSFYWVHRLFHRVPFLWKFHAVHHSIEEMDWLAHGRFHPIETVIVMTVATVATRLSGVNAYLGYWYVAVSYLDWVLHSNVRFHSRLLSFFIATPEFHHWHHSSDPKQHNKNFSVRFPILDLVFGTFYLPKEGENPFPAQYGISDDVPLNYLKHLAYPFWPSWWKQKPAPVEGIPLEGLPASDFENNKGTEPAPTEP